MLIRSPRLAAIKRVRHAFFTRAGGVSEGVYASLNGGQGSNDEPARVAENRRRMTAALQLPDALVTAIQIHSATAVVAEKPWIRTEAPRADAIVTRTPGLAVGVTVADCGPVLLADDAAGVVGAVHAGWKGALAGVIEAAVAAMERLGAERARIAAAIGPLIRQPSYEVGAEFVESFRAADPKNARFFAAAARADRALFDLPGFLVARLQQAGIGDIDDLGLDTYADEARFFSYRRSVHRRESNYGRLIGAIALAE
ncbi:MAG: peptidoglycan editing factor PgeF [Xanthobacteraceae bacterium]|nr:peptidoglycan editing factor PgeF [Xanthobacteraceae bacterium]